MSISPSVAAPMSPLYGRVWRWHFYAGLVCLPFLMLLAITGALYLYKDPINALVYRSLLFVPASSVQVDASPLDADTLVARAQAVLPGEPVRFIAPARAGMSAEVGVETASGVVSVYLDPSDGRVLGQLRDDRKVMEIVKQLHSLSLAGTIANNVIEIVAGWAIVLVVSGVFLWWPRGRTGGVYRVRGRPAQRMWWRDLHAVVGVTASIAIVFLAVTGMPWSAFWGQQFGRLANAWGVGVPALIWGKPQSSVPLSSLGDVPWTLAQTALPLSSHHGGEHAGSATSSPALPQGITLDTAMRTFTRLGLPAGTTVSLPGGPQGVYTAMSIPDDVRSERVVHLDRYSGAVLADIKHADFGIVGQATEWGVSMHTGRQFGWLNQLVMLAACVSIVLLAVTAGVMWWKRRPTGRLGAPPRQGTPRAARSALTVAAVLGVLYPLLGASMIVALLIDVVVLRRWHQRLGM